MCIFRLIRRHDSNEQYVPFIFMSEPRYYKKLLILIRSILNNSKNYRSLHKKIYCTAKLERYDIEVIEKERKT